MGLLMLGSPFCVQKKGTTSKSSEPKAKMFLDLISPNKTNAHKKEVNAHTHLGMCTYFVPGAAHAHGPVDVVKYQYAPICDVGEEPLEIIEGGLVAMIAIYKHIVGSVLTRLEQFIKQG